jgi:lysophospholipase L1-like esterase
VEEARPPTTHEGLLDVEEAPREVVIPRGVRDPGHYPRGTFRKIAGAMVTLVVLVVASYVVPGLHQLQPWTKNDPVPFWNVIGRELLGEGEAASLAVAEVERVEDIAARVEADEQTAPIEDRAVVAPAAGDRLPPYQSHPDDAERVDRQLELPSEHALDRFFARLARTDAGYAGAVTRIIHWGDSAIAADHVSSAIREKLQRRFGDAGHGFHLLAKPNASYVHKGIEFRGGEDWSRCYIINKCKGDGRYGLGGTTVWSSGGAESRFRTADDSANGRKVSRFELWYLADPKGGKIRLQVDDEEPVVIETAAAAPEDRWYPIEVADGPHRFEVRAAGGGRVRAYGVVLERDVPGVVWDGMAQLGAFASRMLYFDADHIRDQIAHRDAALLVFTFGGNDLQVAPSQLDRFSENFRDVLRRFRSQQDPPDCIVMGPVDHGERVGGRIVSLPMVARITDAEREVALAEGCAFFDTTAAMGGEGSAGRWRKSNPPLISGDLAHLTDAGQKVVAHLLYLAMMQRYVEYRGRVDAAP